MKIRYSYVSNSSSSSFIIWGKNAETFCNSIQDGEYLESKFAAQFIWEEMIDPLNYFNSDEQNNTVVFIEDLQWKQNFQNMTVFKYRLPLSIKKDSKYLSDYYNDFINWFVNNFADIKFYEIKFSDHDGETKYHESEMYDLMKKYSDKEYKYINNH